MGKANLDIQDVANRIDELIIAPVIMQHWRSQVKRGLVTYKTGEDVQTAIRDTDPDKNIAAFYTILAFCHDDFLRVNPIINDEMKAINPQLCSYPQICAYETRGFGQCLGACLRQVERDLGIDNKEETSSEGNKKSTKKKKNGVAENVLRRDGERWKVRFQGVESLLENCVGLEYIHILLQNQGKNMVLEELLSEQKKVMVKFFGSDLIHKEQARSDYKKRLREIEQERDQAEKNNDEAALERLEGEKGSIIKQLELEYFGHKKKLKSDSDKARGSIGNAILRAIERINKNIPGLANHLKEAIKKPHSGISQSYNPPQKTEWSL